MPSFPFTATFQPATRFLKYLATPRPQKAKVMVGLDVGSTSIKAVATGMRKGGGVRPVVAYHCAPLEAGSDEHVVEAIRSAVSALALHSRVVNVGVSGQGVVMRIVELPTMKSEELKQSLPFEAQRYLPFKLEDVVIDGVSLGAAGANKHWVLIVACKKELLDRRLTCVKQAGLEVGVIDVDALALANGFLAVGSDTSAGTRALISVGAQMTHVVILKQETLYLVRDIPWGGDKFVRSVGEQVGSEGAAVHQALAKGEASEALRHAFKAASEALVTELQLSFDYFENRFGQPPEEILVSGGVGQSPAVVEALQSHLTQRVSGWTPGQGLSGQFAIAYGLALRTGSS